MKIEEARKLPAGTWVVYCPAHGPREDGRIARVEQDYVFVLYKGDTSPKATAPEDLELPFPSAQAVVVRAEPDHELGLPDAVWMWVDDERQAPPEYMYWARTSAEAIEHLRTDDVVQMSLDYLLSHRVKSGEEEPDNGARVLAWLKDHPDRWPTEKIIAHSSSSDGRALIEEMANDYAPEGWAGTVEDSGGF